ncbi:class I tRNA ligase family protein, partial [Alphaproteobacteria bacterium]|nr:class I tRNA ligase family protein [Alphaproteobacteria bacterium]
LAHPFIPFVTDDIYVNAMGNKKYLMETNWPDSLKVVFEEAKFKSIEKLISIISKIRNIKSTLNIQPKHISDLFYITNDKPDLNILFNKEIFLNSLARVKLKKLDDKKVEMNNSKFLKFIHSEYTFFIDKSDSNDNSVANIKDTNMLNDQLIILDQDIALLTKKIENKEFIKKAPSEVVNKFRNKVEDKKKLKNKILNEIKSV